MEIMGHPVLINQLYEMGWSDLSCCAIIFWDGMGFHMLRQPQIYGFLSTDWSREESCILSRPYYWASGCKKACFPCGTELASDWWLEAGMWRCDS